MYSETSQNVSRDTPECLYRHTGMSLGTSWNVFRDISSVYLKTFRDVFTDIPKCFQRHP